MTASSYASWSRFSPPSDYVDGHVSTMWFMVCRRPQSQEGDWARPRLCKVARHGLDLSGNGPSKTTCDEGDGNLAVGSQARSQRSLCSFWSSVRLSVCPIRSPHASACCGFAAVGPASRRLLHGRRSAAAAPQQQMRAVPRCQLT